MAIRGRKQAFPGKPIKLMPMSQYKAKTRNLTAQELADFVKELVKQNPYLGQVDLTQYKGTKTTFKIKEMHTQHISNAIRKIKSGEHEHYKDALIQTVMIEALEAELVSRKLGKSTKFKKSNIKPADLDGFYFR